jgi:type I restriction enzyme S subunit
MNIPSTWAEKKLSDVCNTTSGGTPSRKRKDYFTGNIPWVKSGELTDGLVRDIEECITDQAIKNSSAKIFPTGTLLIALYGATVGKLGILTRDAASNQAVCAIFPQNELDTKYLFWYLRYVRSDIVYQAIGGAQPNISQGILKNLDIPIAPLAEQHFIVSEIEKQFSRLDEAVAALKRIKANLKRYKASVLKAAVEGKLTEEWRKENCRGEAVPRPKIVNGKNKATHRIAPTESGADLLKRILAERRKKWEKVHPGKKYKEPAAPDTSNLPELPKGWVWVNIEQLAEAIPNAIKAGPFGSSLKKSFYVPKGYKIYGQEQVLRDDPYYGDYYIDEERFRNLSSCSVKPGDILISLVGTIGRVLILPDDIEPGIINPRLVKLSLDSRLMDAKFFKAYLQSPYVKYLFSLISHGGTMDILNLTILKEIPIPLPPLNEQNIIVEELERISSIEKELESAGETNLKRAERLRQSILKKAFSGRIV